MASLFTDCLDNTAAHGLPRLVKPSQAPFFRGLWMLFITMAFTTLSYHTSSLIQQYKDGPTVVNIIPEGTHFVPPDIYLCNQFPLSFSYVELPSKSVQQNLSLLFKQMKHIEQFSNELKLKGFWETLSWAEIHNQFGHKLEQDVLFGRPYLDKDELILIPHWTHLNCFRYKPYTKHSGDKPEDVTLTMYTDTSNMKEGKVKYNDMPLVDLNLQNGVTADEMISGFIVYTVPQNEYPNPDSPHVLISPGFKTDISIHMEVYDLFSNDHMQQCRYTQRNVSYYNPLDPTNPVQFQATERDCFYEKFNQDTFERCNCVGYQFPITMELIASMGGSPRFCHNLTNIDPKNVTDMSLLRKKMKCHTFSESIKYPTFVEKCYSANPCKTIVYKPKIQINKWPVISQLPSIKKEIMNALNLKKFQLNYLMPSYDHIYNVNFSSTDVDVVTMIREEFAQLSITWSEIHAMVMKETYSYKFKNLAADIGGILGFYLGVSVLTMLEIVDLILRLLGYGIKRSKDKLSSEDEYPNYIKKDQYIQMK